MALKNYDDLTEFDRDVIKEIGNIGTGNAAAALSSMTGQNIRMTVPEVKIIGYNEAIRLIGNPEEIIAGILVSMSGELEGVMLYMLKLDFIQLMLQQLCGKTVTDYPSLDDMDVSALVETGNIIISSYVNALSGLTDLSVDLSVPGIAINMLGGIMTVPMAEMGYVTDKLLMIDGKFISNGVALSSHLLMMPDIQSLNRLLEKLGISHD